jgi:hypothetical protein
LKENEVRVFELFLLNQTFRKLHILRIQDIRLPDDMRTFLQAGAFFGKVVFFSGWAITIKNLCLLAVHSAAQHV